MSSKTSFKQLGTLFLNNIFVKNIVLTQAISICPILAIGTHLQYGVVLTVCTALVLLPTSVCMSLLRERVPAWLRAPLYTVGAGALLLGAAYVLSRYVSTDLYAVLDVFLPLMAVNTIFTYRAGGFSVGNPPLTAAVDALGSAFGFGLVICLISALREVACAGTLWGIPVYGGPFLVSAATPFVAWILLAFMAAFLQWIRNRKNKKKGR